MHDIFATHTDIQKGVAGSTDTFNFTPLSFHCACDHFVVESPFTQHVPAFTFQCDCNYVQLTNSSYTFITTRLIVHFDLRGPPLA